MQEDSLGKTPSHQAQPGWLLAGLGTDDRPFDADIKDSVEVVFSTQATTDLERDADSLSNGAKSFEVRRPTSLSAIEINQMQRLCSLTLPVESHLTGIIAVDGLLLKITLPKPNTLARTQIDSRVDDHNTVLSAESLGAE
jgi:hypothetical protein